MWWTRLDAGTRTRRRRRSFVVGVATVAHGGGGEQRRGGVDPDASRAARLSIFGEEMEAATAERLVGSVLCEEDRSDGAAWWRRRGRGKEEEGERFVPTILHGSPWDC